MMLEELLSHDANGSGTWSCYEVHHDGTNLHPGLVNDSSSRSDGAEEHLKLTQDADVAATGSEGKGSNFDSVEEDPSNKKEV